ncbi:Zinc finger, CCHC-type, partial [Dillenia turbinata]
MSRDCMDPLMICHNCGGRGHLAFECPSGRFMDRYPDSHPRSEMNVRGQRIKKEGVEVEVERRKESKEKCVRRRELRKRQRRNRRN